MSNIDYRAQEEALECLSALADCDLSRTETKRLYNGIADRDLPVTQPAPCTSNHANRKGGTCMNARQHRTCLLTYLSNMSANHLSTVEIARTAEAYGDTLYARKYADEGVATCRRDLSHLEMLGKIKRAQNYNGPAYWTVV